MDTTANRSTSSTQHPVVETTSGSVRGRWREHPRGARDAAFLSVPFAQAPTGSLRFAAPRRRAPWEGVRDAGEYGPTAQISPLAEVTTIPEPSVPGDDVLTANVFTPDPGNRQALRPVLVWIHGGGYLAGSPHSSWYDGDTFTRSGAVTVTLGYRLGVEGWLHLEDAPDNRGLLDWIAGLRWVQENIEAFGGDPARVTIAGQSAGGGAVLTLLAAPAARGLFSRAVSFSGAVGEDESPAAAQHISEQFTALTGVAATAAAVGGLARGEADRIARQITDEAGPRSLAFGPFADGATLPEPVLSALRAGAGAEVPLLLGATTHEFVPAVSTVTVEQAREALLSLGGAPAQVEAMLAQRPGTPGKLVGQVVTDLTFRNLVPEVATARAQHRASTWLYEFAWTSTSAAGGGLASHCLDLPFWWGRLDGERVLDATGPNPPQGLADAMHTTFLKFVQGEDLSWGRFEAGTTPAMTWTEEPTADLDPYARTIRATQLISTPS